MRRLFAVGMVSFVATAHAAEVVEVTCQQRHGRTEIEFRSHEQLMQAETKRAQVAMRAPDPSLVPPNGLVYAVLYRTTIGAANTEYFSLIFTKDGKVVARTDGVSDTPEVPGSDDLWWNSLIARVPADLLPPYEVHVADTLNAVRCSARMNADGTFEQVEYSDDGKVTPVGSRDPGPKAPVTSTLSCFEVAKMVEINVPQDVILQTLTRYSRGDSPPECMATLPDAVRAAFEARPAWKP
jgi:hypothetical protein